jgi:hypothetical protein
LNPQFGLTANVLQPEDVMARVDGVLEFVKKTVRAKVLLAVFAEKFNGFVM